MKLDKKTTSDLFGALPSPELSTQLMSITADNSALHECVKSIDRRLGNLEDSSSRNQELVKVVAAVQGATSENATDIAELKTRAETIAKNAQDIKLVDYKVQTLEKNIINDGETRMKSAEDALRDRATRSRAVRETVLKMVAGAVLGCAGWMLAHYVPGIMTALNIPFPG